MSMYIDIEEQIENRFTSIDEILQFEKRTRILIAADSNSRFNSWYDKNNKFTRENLEE